jgi:hypothetical protein
MSDPTAIDQGSRYHERSMSRTLATCAICLVVACSMPQATGQPGSLAPVGSVAATSSDDGPGVRHYVYFNTKRERIAEPWFLASADFEGAQLKYTWAELEPERDRYALDAISRDLTFLERHGKRLFVQLQDVSFDASIMNAPPYLLADTSFHGGVAGNHAQDADSTRKPQGYVARRWDPAVRQRFQMLFDTLGRAFDGRIEGINLPETSVEFGTTGTLHPSGFSPDSYRDGVVDNMRALRRSFPRSVAMQYGNFMPGEWLPADDHGYLRSVYAEARQLRLGMGGPDLLPSRRGQQNHTYAMLRAYRGVAPTAVAVQWDNLAETNPKSGARVTVQELVDFATNELDVRYIFWEPQEPFFSRDVVPFLHARSAASSRRR